MITHPRPWFTSGLMAMLLFAALHVGALSPATAADFDKGMTAYRSGDYQAALAEWRLLAESGHATAQYNLGSCMSRRRAWHWIWCVRMYGTTWPRSMDPKSHEPAEI